MDDKMFYMSDKEIEKAVENEIEWRKLMWKELEAIRKEQFNLSLSIAVIKAERKTTTAIFGILFGFIGSLIPAALKYFTKN